MIARLGNAFYRIAVRIVPDPFVLAIGLTLVVMALAALRLGLAGGEGAIAWTILGGWADGFGSTGGLAFALQMSLILVTGHALAVSPPVQRFIDVVAKLPRSAATASALVALVACAAGMVHWGLGAIVGAFLARELARNAVIRNFKIHYPLLGAAAYSGLVVWHGGLSGSAPLKVAEEGHFAVELSGVIPLSETLLSPLNFTVEGLLLLLIPLLFFVMTPEREEDLVAPSEEARRKHAAPEGPPAYSGVVFGLLGLAFVVYAVAAGRLAFDLNSVILFFLFLGMSFQGSLVRYADTIADGARGAGGIILQFPFYFGILGVMKAGNLIAWISEGMLSISSPATFPLVAFFSAGLVNMFVPSGGGQWAVQADILLSAAKALGVSPATTVMAFAYGDSWTNSLQPFWALPLLGIMGLSARDIIGYTVMVFLLVGIVVSSVLLAWS